ncbi:hypothetical protein RHMOL_Rhmol02G0094300 [Rhododendron molle]|uniref:Uncharacterized protein n=1 Tax=Rhododendron molle TaxID=49168 RepID=A0ACC0PNM9_RHOML|nr:hypothetical protein RHMOL_Rhmol02G0094300 [Rhododendron molle]
MLKWRTRRTCFNGEPGGPQVSNPGSRNAETLVELLKKEREIETTEEAIRIVSSPRELKIKESAPKGFKCPMSAEIMGDPVVVASGQVRLTVQLHS